MFITRRDSLLCLALLPFIAMGSTRVAQSQEVEAVQEPVQADDNQVMFFSARRHKPADGNGKSFIWLKANDATEELKKHLMEAHGAPEEGAIKTIQYIDHMTNVFNQTAREKEQVEIRLRDLKNPPGIPKSISELTEKQISQFLKDADIKTPSVRDYLDANEKVHELTRRDGATQRFNIIQPQGILTTHGFPVSLHLQEGIDVVKDSIAKKFFVDPRSGSFEPCIYLDLEETAGFLGEGGKSGVIIPAEVSPTAIVTPKKMYLIGFGDDIKEEQYDPKAAVPHRNFDTEKNDQPKDKPAQDPPSPIKNGPVIKLPKIENA